MGPLTRPGKPQATDHPHAFYVCGSPVVEESLGSLLQVLAARGTGGP